MNKNFSTDKIMYEIILVLAASINFSTAVSSIAVGVFFFSDDVSIFAI